MRLLHVYSGNLYGGIETILVALARYRELCPVLVQEFALCFDGRLSRELEALGVPVHSLGEVRASRPLTIRRARRALATLVGSARYDRVICHAPWSLWALRRRRAARGRAARPLGTRCDFRASLDRAVGETDETGSGDL